MKIKNQLCIKNTFLFLSIANVFIFFIFTILILASPIINKNLILLNIHKISMLYLAITLLLEPILCLYGELNIKRKNKLKIMNKINEIKWELSTIENISKKQKKDMLENLYSEIDFVIKNIDLKNELNFNKIPSYIKIKNLINKKEYEKEIENKLNNFKHIDNHKKSEVINKLGLELERFDKSNKNIIKIEELSTYSDILKLEKENLKIEIESYNNNVKEILNIVPEEINDFYLNEDIIENEKDTNKIKNILEKKKYNLYKKKKDLNNDLKIKELFEI